MEKLLVAQRPYMEQVIPVQIKTEEDSRTPFIFFLFDKMVKLVFEDTTNDAYECTILITYDDELLDMICVEEGKEVNAIIDEVFKVLMNSTEVTTAEFGYRYSDAEEGVDDFGF